MRTYKETLQLIKRAAAIVTQVGTKDNLNLTKTPPAFSPVKVGQTASRQAGKNIQRLASNPFEQNLKKNQAKPIA